MKKLALCLLVITALVSCKDHDVYSGSNDTSVDTIVDTSFKFSTRTNCDIIINAKDAYGNGISKALFSIYTSNPQGEEGRLSTVLPIYQGFTSSEGKIGLSGLPIPSGTDSIYVYPEYGGFGFPQIAAVKDLSTPFTFTTTNITSSAAKTRSIRKEGSTEIVRSQIPLGNNYKYYTYFNDQEVTKSTGTLNPGNGVVSSETLSTSFLEKVNELFPEKQAYFDADLTKNTDIKVTADAGSKIWVTFLGDGGFVTSTANKNIYNSLYYYTYTESNKPSRSYIASNGYLKDTIYHLTCALPNVNPSYITPGVKVQLLYYDSTKGVYVETFPKGTYIGFDLNYMGYNYLGSLSSLGYSLSNSGETKKGMQYFSSPKFNGEGETHGIIQWSSDDNCYIVGMERQGHSGGASGDMDFNDILAKVTISPANSTSQEETPSKPAVVIGDNQSGRLAFEDLWPDKGDYDFNDFVTDYTYSTVKDVNNNVTAIKLKFTPKAIGAASTNGFGIELPVAGSNVDATNMVISTDKCDAKLEDASAEKAVIIVYNDVRKAFNSMSGYINTVKGSVTISSTPVEITIPLITAVSGTSITFSGFNPFLFAGKRNHEIHLVDYAPTPKADLSLFNSTKYEKSDVSKGIYYRMNNTYPWALDISDTSWMWPYEEIEIGTAYSGYSSWYSNWTKGNDIDWISTVKTGNVYVESE